MMLEMFLLKAAVDYEMTPSFRFFRESFHF